MKFIVQFQILRSYNDQGKSKVEVVPNMGRESEIYAVYHKVFSSPSLPAIGSTINLCTWGDWEDYRVLAHRYEPQTLDSKVLLPVVILETAFNWSPLSEGEIERDWLDRNKRDLTENAAYSGVLAQGFSLVTPPCPCAAGNLRMSIDDYQLPFNKTDLAGS